LDLLRDALARTIRENPDISTERIAAGLPGKNSALRIDLGPEIVDREGCGTRPQYLAAAQQVQRRND